MGLRWPFPASVSIVSAAVTSDHCVCICRSPQRCTCSATPRARGTNRPCETVAASRDGSCPMRKWCVSPTPCQEQTSNHPVKEYSPSAACVMYKKTKRHLSCLLWRGHYYCLYIPLYTATAPLLALWDYKWALKCTQLGFSASVEGWHHPLVSRLFLSWSAFPWEGSSLMQGNLSGCNMRLAFQQRSLWGWQLLVLYAAPLAPAAPSFKAFFSVE